MTELTTLKNHCATCRHWDGNKEKAEKMFADNPKSMDLKWGWPESGRCSLQYDFMNIDILGDSCVCVTFDANFGCVHWSE